MEVAAVEAGVKEFSSAVPDVAAALELLVSKADGTHVRLAELASHPTHTSVIMFGRNLL